MPRERPAPPLKPRVLQMLLALAREPLHGYALMQRVEEASEGRVRVGPATLYRTLDRLEADGLLEGRADDPRDERRVTYALTASGRRALEDELARLDALLGEARRAGALQGGGG